MLFSQFGNLLQFLHVVSLGPSDVVQVVNKRLFVYVSERLSAQSCHQQSKVFDVFRVQCINAGLILM